MFQRGLSTQKLTFFTHCEKIFDIEQDSFVTTVLHRLFFNRHCSLLLVCSQELLLVDRFDSHPEEEDGDEGDDEDH